MTSFQCVTCHQKSNLLDVEVRRRLAEQCGAPLGAEATVKVRANFDLKKVQSAGRALRANNLQKNVLKKIPVKRVEELENVLKEHFSVEEVTGAVIEEAANCSFTEENADYVPHSRAVVAHYLQHRGGLLQLEVGWRMIMLIDTSLHNM